MAIKTKDSSLVRSLQAYLHLQHEVILGEGFRPQRKAKCLASVLTTNHKISQHSKIRPSGWLESWEWLFFVTDVSTTCAEAIFRVIFIFYAYLHNFTYNQCNLWQLKSLQPIISRLYQRSLLLLANQIAYQGFFNFQLSKIDHSTLEMASAQVVKTSLINNSPSQDSSHPNGHFQSRYVTPGFKVSPSSYLQ